MGRLLWEVFSDRLYVTLSIIGAVAVVVYMWVKVNDKSKSRYKS
ncbi:EYxxD motif small membrane protein [Aneurinibacillus terranovensis]|nr:EYxxD motif small membrane protein [Aneurinibacillus terranovensis]